MFRTSIEKKEFQTPIIRTFNQKASFNDRIQSYQL
jgi:hypothetical protein